MDSLSQMPNIITSDIMKIIEDGSYEPNYIESLCMSVQVIAEEDQAVLTIPDWRAEQRNDPAVGSLLPVVRWKQKPSAADIKCMQPYVKELDKPVLHRGVI